MRRQHTFYLGAWVLVALASAVPEAARAQLDLSQQSGGDPLSLDGDVDVDFTQAAVDAQVDRLQRNLTIEVPYRFDYLPAIFQQARITCRIETTFVQAQGGNQTGAIGYHESLSLSGGSAEGTVQVGGTYPPDSYLQQYDLNQLRQLTNITPTSWQCYLDVNGPQIGQWAPAQQLCQASQYCDGINHVLINAGQF